MELLWFIPSMGDEARLGDPQGAVPPTRDHLVAVARAAEAAGFSGVLVPAGELCHDGWVVASTLAQHTTTLRFLVAFRPGFVNPPVAARMASTLDRMTGGRCLLNVVTGGHLHELAKDGDFVRSADGDFVQPDHGARYRRTEEFLDVVLRSWHDEPGFTHDGEFFHVERGGVAQAPEQRPHPPIYLGGASDDAVRIAARFADVYLLWGEPVDRMADRAAAATRLAAERHGRALRVGTRFQVVCRATDAEAEAAAKDLVSSISDDYREAVRGHADRTDSVGQARQNELRGGESEWLAPGVWNGFARARMGASVALVGSPATIARTLAGYVDAGIDTFILSGYRHDEEAARVGDLLMPTLKARAGGNRLPLPSK